MKHHLNVLDVLLLEAVSLRQIVVLHRILVELLAKRVPFALQTPDRSDREVLHHAVIVASSMTPKMSIDQDENGALYIDTVCVLQQVFQHDL